jgi:hypothetical protein
LDESIAFGCVKPLHYTLFSAHLLTPLTRAIAVCWA